jgi:hypothetical protein
MRSFVFVCLASALSLVAACGPSTSETCTACGDNECADLSSDPTNCGACGVVCPSGQVCDDSACVADGQASCDNPGATEDCYTGTIGTNGVGPCHGGTRTCLVNGYWSSCTGEVTPGQDVCGDGVDQDCDGTADNPTDEDGDGFTNCTGDCCDSTAEGCVNPERVNPGAIEVDGNTLDDDCDGNVDNATAQPLCDSGLTSNSPNAMDYAKAMDLCAETTENDPHWGVISARFVKADGTGSPNANQKAIRPAFGSTLVQNGESMVVISTANAAATGQTNPPAAPWQSTAHGATSGYPADWYAANNNSLPNAPGCPPPVDIFGQANDPVMLELKVKTPTNAASFSMRVNFMSAEFPEYTCTAFNDFFVVLLDSAWNATPPNPMDKNLAFYTNPQNQVYPVGVNLAHGNTGLFQVCKNGSTGCNGTAGTINTCVSDAELAGTGMEVADPDSCEPNSEVGGGTGWLTTSGNVNGGEIITIRIALWDTSDGAYDSVAMIDNFQWSLNPSDPGTVVDVD